MSLSGSLVNGISFGAVLEREWHGEGVASLGLAGEFFLVVRLVNDSVHLGILELNVAAVDL